MVLDGCEVDVAQCELVRGEERHHLTTKEVEVLAYFAQHPSRSISYEELLERVWGHSRLASTQPVYSVIKRLRRKIDGFGEHRHLVTVHGMGYRFEPPPSVRAAEPTERSRSLPPPTIPLASFVGRAREIAAVTQALAAGARIVSIVGPGGAGKTRLALELVAQASEQGDELVLADLSDAQSADDVDLALAAAVGARGGDDDAPGATARSLRARGARAIVLDNAEQVLDAVATVAVALAARVPVIVTSRERLGVAGEHVIDLGPMREDDGAALFAERALAAGAIVEGDALVRRIVLRLDGLPLAIELAAAQAGVVSLEHVERELDRQIDSLHATRRHAPTRHATLRSSVAWSWERLEPEAQAVLAQCVVFAGGFTLEAAEAVVSVKGGARSQIVRLRERSLLRVVGSSRLAPYEAVRELASEQLAQRAAVEERHARWAWAQARSSGALDEVPPASAYALLAPELDNLRVAFRRSLATDPARAAELALAIDLVESPSRGPGVAPELTRALAAVEGALAVRVRLALGRSREHRGEEGLGFLDATRALARAHGTPLDQLEADRQWASSLSTLGEPGAALAPLEEALVRARDIAPASAVLGRLALDLAETHLAAGSVERTRSLATEAGRALERAGEPTHAARAWSALAHVHRETGQPDAALTALERARRLLEDAGDEVALARLALERGALLAHVSRTEEALASLVEATLAHHRLGLVTGEMRSRDWCVLALLGLGRDDEALAQARAMAQLALDLGRPSYEAERAFGATWLVSGRLAEADAALGRALDVLAAGGKANVRGHVLSVRALVRTLSGRLAEAEADLALCVQVHEGREGEAARMHSRAELALVRELIAADPATDAILADAERLVGAPWEQRHARGRRAIVDIVRARRAGAGPAEIAALADAARAELTDVRGAPIDYFTRCTLLLVDHVARG